VDLDQEKVAAQESVVESWFGLAVAPDGKRAWWAGGGANQLYPFGLTEGKLSREFTEIPRPRRERRSRRSEEPQSQPFRSGLCLDAESQTLYSLDINDGRIDALDPADLKVKRSAKCGGRPYDVVVSKNRALLYVSDWAGRAV